MSMGSCYLLGNALQPKGFLTYFGNALQPKGFLTYFGNALQPKGFLTYFGNALQQPKGFYPTYTNKQASKQTKQRKKQI
jgi:hypothetical protein